jgi:hypothetical protein
LLYLLYGKELEPTHTKPYVLVVANGYFQL